VLDPRSRAGDRVRRRLKALADELRDDLFVVMRAYFEKPRTTVGWKGYINDPHLDGSFAINEGLERARRLLLELPRSAFPPAPSSSTC
jgi:3-deoxy-7-phosphoheptulonate synthase